MRISDYDRFGEEGLSKEEYAKRQDYVLSKCKCTGCPTFVKGDNPEGAYCFPMVGTSKAIQWEKECLCETCPIYKEYELGPHLLLHTLFTALSDFQKGSRWRP